jgi:tetratricopeptide (TPR) repeat protein
VNRSHAFRLQERFEVLWLAGRHAEASLLAEEFSRLIETSFPSDHPFRVRALLNLALAYHAARRSEDAHVLEQRAEALLVSLSAAALAQPCTPAAASWFLFEAERRWALEGDTPDVRALLDRGVDVRLRCLGPSHVDTAEALAQRAELDFLSGDFRRAETGFREELAVFEPHPDLDSPWPLKALSALAKTLAALERWNESQIYFERALSMDAEALLPPARYALLTGYAEVLAKTGNAGKTKAVQAQANALLPKVNPAVFEFRG